MPTDRSTSNNPNGQNSGHGITGTSVGWVPLTADLGAYFGNLLVGFRYWTDGAMVNPGFMIDEISIAGGPTDGVEADAGWTLAPTSGFRITTGTEQRKHLNAYVAEHRKYRGYDRALQTGAYSFGFLNTAPDFVETFPYQDGLLISYWDSSQTDNSTSAHPGTGLLLPIDSHPEAFLRPDGTPWRARVQSYDSPFGLSPTDPITLHVNAVASSHPSLSAVPVFDDSRQSWNSQTPTAGVRNPHTGTQIRVKSISALGGFMEVQVRPSK